MRICVAWLALLFCGHCFAVELHGELRQGGMIWGEVAVGSQLYLDGSPVKVAENGVFVLGFGRDAKPIATLLIEQPGGEREELALQVAQRKYRIQRVEGVPQRTVTPPEAALQRIRKEAELVRAARADSRDAQDFAVGFQWPLIGPVTGVYGSQRVYNGKPGRPHFGVDVARPVGATVVAPASGEVKLAHPDMFYSGGTLIIDHGMGVSSTFIHLSRILVVPGQRVEPGDEIAEVGATGRATGPHLDWRMNWYNVRLDPQLLVGPMPSGRTGTQVDYGSGDD